MVSTFTPNLGAELVGRGDQVGTWDTPENSNWSIYDRKFGTVQNISLAAGNVTLSSVQAQSGFLIFSGALAGNTTVTIPGLSSAPGVTISGAYYTIQNQCTNSSVNTVTIQTTVAGQQVVGVPPFEAMDIFIEGTGSSIAGSVKFRTLDRVGTYWDFAGSSVPRWVSACTVPPYLNCDGTTFSSATYPALTLYLGGTTLPDTRGRLRAALNQGTGRLTSTGGGTGIDGNTAYASGGNQTISQANLPAVTLTVQSSAGSSAILAVNSTGAIGNSVPSGANSYFLSSGYGTISVPLGGAGTNFNPPAYIGGLTLIRAA